MANPAFEALIRVATQSKGSTRELPAQTNITRRWSGVGFGCLGERFVIPMGKISELMEVPPITRLPGVQSWVIGLSNVRGRLLPLFDLARFVGGQISHQKKAHRVLVMESDGMYSGLVVDRAYGMQHFVADSIDSFNGELPMGLKQYVSGAFKDSSGENWCVFNMDALSEDPNFVNASAT